MVDDYSRGLSVVSSSDPLNSEKEPSSRGHLMPNSGCGESASFIHRASLEPQEWYIFSLEGDFGHGNLLRQASCDSDGERRDSWRIVRSGFRGCRAQGCFAIGYDEPVGS